MTNKKSYSKIGLFLRSLLFFIYSVTSISLYSFIVVFAMLFPLRYRCTLIRNFLYVYIYVLKVVCRIDYKIEGHENIPKDRNGIFMSKHQSTWETFFFPIVFNMPAAIAKRELLWIPLFGWGFAASEPILINRNDKSSAMQQIIREGKKRLEQGRWVMVFPEGTRMAPGETGKYRLGGARLAAVTGYPVIPIAHNAGTFWRRRQFIKYPGTIHVVIGPLIETQGKTADEILTSVKNWIEGTMPRLEGNANKTIT